MTACHHEPSSVAATTVTTTTTTTGPAASASAAPLDPKATGGEIECRATNGTQTLVLNLAWEQGRASGTLASGGAARAVVAIQYKGLILVDPAGSANVTGKLATVTTEGKRTIRLGDDRSALDCQ